jgi:hypothetical protein
MTSSELLKQTCVVVVAAAAAGGVFGSFSFACLSISLLPMFKYHHFPKIPQTILQLKQQLHH